MGSGSKKKKEGSSRKKHDKDATDTSSSNTLTSCLRRLLVVLQKKDEYKFFGQPVDLEEVPDYLHVIKQPMDFGTISKKIENGDYSSIEQFQHDFELICLNAKKYNSPGTIFYQQADKMLGPGKKLISKEASRLAKQLEALQSGSSFVDEDDIDVVSNNSRYDPAVRVIQHGPGLSDDEAEEFVSPSSAIESTPKMVFKRSKNQLTLPTIAPAFGLPRKRALYRKTMEGTFVFSSAKRQRTMHSDGSLIASGLKEMGVIPTHSMPQAAVPTLGALFSVVNEAKEWALSAPNNNNQFKIPIPYHDHGPFATFGPHLDGKDANCTAAESDLLALTYADLESTSYVTSIESFVRDTSDFARLHATRILDALTGGAHSVVKIAEEEMAQLTAKGEPITELTVPNTPPATVLSLERKVGFDIIGEMEKLKEYEQSGGALPKRIGPVTIAAVRSLLQESGVNTDFLPADEEEQVNSTQAILDKNSEFIWQLMALQRERLTRSRANPLSDVEKSLANILRDRLVQLIHATPPGTVVSRKALELAIPKVQPFEAVFLGTMIAPPQARPPPAASAAPLTPMGNAAAARPSTPAARPPPPVPAMAAAAIATGRPTVPAAPGQPQAAFRTVMTPTQVKAPVTTSSTSNTPASTSKPVPIRPLPPGGQQQCSNCSSTDELSWLSTNAGTELLCNACGQYYQQFHEPRPESMWRPKVPSTPVVPAQTPSVPPSPAFSAEPMRLQFDAVEASGTAPSPASTLPPTSTQPPTIPAAVVDPSQGTDPPAATTTAAVSEPGSEISPMDVS